MGAGPAGLFAAFQLGLFNIRSTIVDSQQVIGGQCTAFYADKPIYDVPGFPSILAGALIDRLYDQLSAIPPNIILGCRVVSINTTAGERRMLANLANGNTVEASAVILATGGGAVDTTPVLFGEEGGELQDVDVSTFQTRRNAVFAVGDAAAYVGKLRLILSAFHEAALMTQAVRKLLADSPSGKGPGNRRRARQRSMPDATYLD